MIFHCNNGYTKAPQCCVYEHSLPSYDFCTTATYSRHLTCDGTKTARKDDHIYLKWGHTDAQAGLCRMQRIVRTDFLNTICRNFFYKNPKMEILSSVWTRIYDVTKIPYFDIQLLLISVAHVVTGSVLQQNVVFSEFTHGLGKCWNIRSYC